MSSYIDSLDDLALPQKPFKVVAVIPVHERLELLPLTIGRLYKKNGVDTVICVGDGIKEKAICIESGAKWVHHKNKPLGAKWNFGFQAAKALNPDAVLYVGSSDWVCNNWIDIMKPYVEQHHIVGVAGMSLIDVSEKIRACHWPGYVGPREDESIGLGRMISASLLNKIGWSPFDRRKDVSMDRCMKDKCAALGVKEVIVKDSRLKSVSISTSKWSNLHKFEQHWSNMLPSEKIFDTEKILKDFPEADLLFNALK